MLGVVKHVFLYLLTDISVTKSETLVERIDLGVKKIKHYITHSQYYWSVNIRIQTGRTRNRCSFSKTFVGHHSASEIYLGETGYQIPLNSISKLSEELLFDAK